MLRAMLPALRVLAFSLASMSFAFAPYQCGGRKPDDRLRVEEEPGEALYGLAMKFRDEGNPEASRKTLRFIVERYPTSRFAVMAGEDLAQAPLP